MLKERVHLLNEMPDTGHYFFEEPRSLDEKTLLKKYKPEQRALFERLITALQSHPSFDADSLESAVKEFAEAEQVGLGAILPILRLALAGTVQGPPAFNMMSVLGREVSLQRFSNSLDRFDALVNCA